LRESRVEFKRVNWPTFNRTMHYTLVVVGLSLTLAVFLGILDFVFVYILRKFFV